MISGGIGGKKRSKGHSISFTDYKPCRYKPCNDRRLSWEIYYFESKVQQMPAGCSGTPSAHYTSLLRGCILDYIIVDMRKNRNLLNLPMKRLCGVERPSWQEQSNVRTRVKEDRQTKEVQGKRKERERFLKVDQKKSRRNYKSKGHRQRQIRPW